MAEALRQAGLQRDIDVTRAIAKQFPDIEILVDGNNGFTVDQFIQYLDGIGDIPLFWIEEPFPGRTRTAPKTARLARRTRQENP